MTRSEATGTSGQTSVATADGEAVAGGLRQGTRREPVAESASPVDRLATGSQPETPRRSPPSRDPWVRQPAPSIPDDGRPVATVDPSIREPHQSRGVDEWLSAINNESSQVATQETEGWARLSDIVVEPEASATPRNPFSGQTSLASSQQSGDRPIWASSPTPQMAQPTRNSSNLSQQSTANSTSTPQTQSISQQSEAPRSTRRTDSLLQVDALLSRAHDFEAQGQPHEAYRFALAAHRIVETERLALPPGQERPIDYLDALSAAADTAQRAPSRSTQHNTPSIPVVEQPWPPTASTQEQHFGREQHPWLEASSSGSGESPFRQASSFAEWRTFPQNQPTLTSPTESRSATFDASTGPTIRSSSFGVHRDASGNTQHGVTETPGDSGHQNTYGPRFSDPTTSANSGSRSINVQPVSLTTNLTDEIETAALSEPHHGHHHTVMPPAWQGSSSMQTPSSVPMATAMNPVLPAPQLGPSANGGFGQPFTSFQGPSFGPAGSPAETAGTNDSLSINDLDELATEADAEDSGRLAGKPLAFWAMIGGLVLLLGCALLRRPTESRESFH